jgi:hypothetical protein
MYPEELGFRAGDRQDAAFQVVKHVDHTCS